MSLFNHSIFKIFTLFSWSCCRLISIKIYWYVVSIKLASSIVLDQSAIEFNCDDTNEWLNFCSPPWYRWVVLYFRNSKMLWWYNWKQSNAILPSILHVKLMEYKSSGVIFFSIKLMQWSFKFNNSNFLLSGDCSNFSYLANGSIFHGIDLREIHVAILSKIEPFNAEIKGALWLKLKCWAECFLNLVNSHWNIFRTVSEC